MNGHEVYGLRGAPCALLCALLLSATSPGFAQQSPAEAPAVERAAKLVGIFEALEAGQDPRVTEVPDGEAVASAYRALDEYLATRPDDVPALIWSARLGRILTVMEPVVLNSAEQTSAPMPELESAVAALSHAIEIEPGNAEAHYWLARTYGITVPRIVAGRYRPGPLDGDQAIAHIRQAVAAAPTEMTYREALAIYLASAERHAEALEAFGDDAAARDHPLRRILADFDAIPLPEGAKLSSLQTATAVETFTSSGRFEDYAQFRARVFAAMGSHEPFEASFRSKWPDFELVELDRYEGEDGSETIGLVQVLQEQDGALQPMPPRDVEESMRNDESPEGISVIVQDISNPSQELLEWHGLAPAERITVLTLVDLIKSARTLVALTELGEDLVGEWQIEEWSYRGDRGRESYSGTLTIAEPTAGEFVGELFSRSSGNWGRQRMRIEVDGDRLDLTGTVIDSGGQWFPDNLSLRVEGDQLSGTSVDTSGQGGRIVFTRQ